jgi:hypothetical protein
MLNFNQSKNRLAVVGCALAGLVYASSANAVTESVEAEVEFVAPITITETRALQYGLLDRNMLSPETIIIAPDSSPPTGTGIGRIVGGAQNAALLTVTATNVTPISILVDNINNGAYYALTAFTCDYDGGTDTACDSAFLTNSASSAVLRVGATLTAAGGAAVGTDFGSFDVTVIYQ